MTRLQSPLLLLLTGERGVGKSTLCLRLAEELMEQSSVTLRGVITLRRGRDRYARLLPGGEEILLARHAASARHAEAEQAGGDTTAPRIGPYVFSPEPFARTERLLRDSSDPPESPAPIAMVDEIGPLELFQGQGFRKVLPVITQAPYRAALIVVRPSLLGKLREVLGERNLRTHRLTPAKREEVHADLFADLLSGGDREA